MSIVDTLQSELFFKNNGYCYLTDVINQNLSKELAEHLFKLKREGKTTVDPQCPLSDSVYGDPIFDNLLQQLAKPLSDQLGVELSPTYTYARIYRPGEELKIHVDRDACEISATMTLDFPENDRVWPILMSKNSNGDNPQIFEIPRGSMVVYRGCELHHWRPIFKGSWQCQVFFHFVDKNGPRASHAMDGRKQLGMKKEENVESSKVVVPPQNEIKYGPIFNTISILSQSDDILPGYIQINSTFLPELKFTENECRQLIELASMLYATEGKTGPEGKVNKEIRNVDVYDIPYSKETENVYKKIAHVITKVNNEYYQYDLSGIQHSLQLLHYKHQPDRDGHYDWHVDFGPGINATRKLSVSIQLSNPDKYSGGDLEVNNHGLMVTAPKEQGAISIFPSYMYHRVADVTAGERWALVIWVHGFRRFK